jgi:hypothetical protein
VSRGAPLLAELNDHHRTGATNRAVLGASGQQMALPGDPRRDPHTGFVGSVRERDMEAPAQDDLFRFDR